MNEEPTEKLLKNVPKALHLPALCGIIIAGMFKSMYECLKGFRK